MVSTIQKFFVFAGQQSGKLKKGMALTVINSAFQALQIAAIYVVLQDILEDTVTWQTAGSSFAIMLVSIVGTIVVGHLSRMDEIEASFAMCVDKRIEIGQRLRYMPMGYFNSVNLGEITSIMTNTLDDMQDTAPRVMDKTIHGFIHAAVLTIAMIFIDWRIGTVVLIGVIVFLQANSAIQQRARDVTGKRIAAQTSLVGAVLEYVLGMGVVRAFNMSSSARNRIDKAIQECEDQNLALELAFVPLMFLQSSVLRLASVLIVLTSIYLYLQDTMDLARCILMVISSFVIYSQLDQAGGMSALMRAVDVSIDRINALRETPVMDEKDTLVQRQGLDIRAEHVTFSYGATTIINDVSFVIPERTVTAIVGPSGGGKSTLCSLIARFWDVDSGVISVGGKDVRDYGFDSLMEHFSVVFQHVYLFSDTIANNIKFGKPDATLEEIIVVAKKANCHGFISELPCGYDTLIGEGGATLSGGEKQRISIARAMLKDAPIIILDEATANVDPENESILQEAIAELTKNKTIIMIAHRLKTVRHAHQVLVMDQGSIVQSGTHEELMEQGGIYANFIRMREKSIGWKLMR